jgi:hypothetical protein
MTFTRPTIWHPRKTSERQERHRRQKQFDRGERQSRKFRFGLSILHVRARGSLHSNRTVGFTALIGDMDTLLRVDSTAWMARRPQQDAFETALAALYLIVRIFRRRCRRKVVSRPLRELV